MTRQANSQVASARPRRSPLSRRNRLEIKNKEAGYFYRIVNDVDDNVELLLDRGYEIVPDAKVGSKGDRRVDNTTSPGTAAHFSVGQGTKALVMRIKDEWKKEDDLIKAQVVDDSEQTLKHPKADYGTLERKVKYSEG